MKILITGSNGYIGGSMSKKLKNVYNVTAVTKKDFDLLSLNDTSNWFKDKSYDCVLHCAIRGGHRMIKDDNSVFDNNLKMFDNLLQNKKSFKKLISFGSGAELFHNNTPYSNSKREILKKIIENKNFYSLRIFSVFDENELPTRFIKSNIIRYINKNAIVVHKNNKMDFIYMDDLVNIVKYFIENKNLPKSINCVYEKKYNLYDIAEMINQLDDYKVPIIVENTNSEELYCGPKHNLNISEIGIEKGLKNTFKELK